jgi:glycosyltransferase involved in cell wall biosynthesis
VKNKIAFFSVVFPSIEKYLDDFFKSLEGQTYKAFEVFIVNDGIEGFENYSDKFRKLNIIKLDFNDKPSKIREFGIREILKRGYETIVFGDSDDYFEQNRIEVSQALLKKYDIVVNEIKIVNERNEILQKGYLSKRIHDKEVISLESIKEKNFMGLSNTAVKSRILKNFELNEDLIAVDWYIFSILLKRGYKAIFTDKTATFYRQHGNNTIGIGSMNAKKLSVAIMTKLLHYKEMLRTSPEYEKLYEEMKVLQKRISDRKYMDEYLAFISRNKNMNTFWWEDIRLVEIRNENKVD